MPQWMLAAFAEELTRIDAEEALHQVNVLQAGTGVMKQSRARALLARWRRLASARRARRPATEGEWRAGLARAGLKLVEVPRD